MSNNNDQLRKDPRSHREGWSVYNKSAEELKEEKWFATVKYPTTRDFFQWSDLKQVGIDPPDPEAAKRRYSIKIVNTIFRICHHLMFLIFPRDDLLEPLLFLEATGSVQRQWHTERIHCC